MMKVNLTVSYGKTAFKSLKCSLGNIGFKPYDESGAGITGDAILVFDKDTVELDYSVTQPCLLTTFGVLYNDNIALQLAWRDPGAPTPRPTPATTPTPFPAASVTCVAPTFPPPPRRQARSASASPIPTLAPASIAAMPSPLPTATPRPPAQPLLSLVASTDANPSCQATFNGNPAPELCTVAAKRGLKAPTWTGSIKLPFAAIRRAGLPLVFALRVVRNVRGAPDLPVFNSRRVVVVIEEFDTVAHQQYVGWAPAGGHASNGGVIRQAATVSAALTPIFLTNATFADDATKVLATRDAAAGSLKAPSVKAFGCNSCGTFFGTDIDPFKSPFGSASTLGVDLSAFGVDTVPFSTDSISFSIDAGYKAILQPKLSPGTTTSFGASTFDGTTSSSGYARDNVVTALHKALGAGSALQVGLFHVVAQRSVLPTAAPKTTAALLPTLTHSANSQISVSYQLSPEARQTVADTRARGAGSDPAAQPPLTYSTLLRYGTQYGGGSQVFDLAASMRRDPAALDPHSSAFEQSHLAGALGFHSVGANYNPIDGTFDAHVGEHGPYGMLQYIRPVSRLDGFNTATYKVGAYAFTDGAVIRDQQIIANVSYPLSAFWSLQSNDAFGHLTVSQAGRANGILVTDAAGGRDLLPNSSYNLQLTYKRAKVFQVTGGYSVLYGQGCNTVIAISAVQPCYPIRTPTAVGNLAWVPFERSHSPLLQTVFIEASEQASSTAPFRTATNNVLDTPTFDYYETTAGRIVRSAAVGAVLFSTNAGCGTLLLTSANRGGDINRFGGSAPKPGYTNTASMEVVPGGGWPSLFFAYSRTQNIGDKVAQPQYLLRAQFGVPPLSFAQSAKGHC
jgi:hypothetical protein